MSESGKEFSVVHLHLEELGHALSEIELVPTEAPEACKCPSYVPLFHGSSLFLLFSFSLFFLAPSLTKPTDQRRYPMSWR